MSKNVLVHYAMLLVWISATLVLLNTGLKEFGFDIFSMGLFQTTLSFLLVPIAYMAGVAGIINVTKLINSNSPYWCSCCNSLEKCACPTACKIKKK